MQIQLLWMQRESLHQLRKDIVSRFFNIQTSFLSTFVLLSGCKVNDDPICEDCSFYVRWTDSTLSLGAAWDFVKYAALFTLLIKLFL